MYTWWLKQEQREFRRSFLGMGLAGSHIVTQVKKFALGIFQPPFSNPFPSSKAPTHPQCPSSKTTRPP